LEDLFHREQLILDGVVAHISELRKGSPVNLEMFELLAKEYGIILKQLQKIVKISDKTSGILIKDQKYSQEKINELESELLQNQISIMLSQIRPHFLYNSLVAIQELCLIDPETANKAVAEFSYYLRGNLDSLSIKRPIPFEKELRHVEAYLSLEKKRFGEKLNINYDISALCFSIPALTLQPIVENAVQHGVTKREDGGAVTVSVKETETGIIITVIDDGVGFDPNSVSSRDARLHIGIENVRSRLSFMCNGTLTIQSEPGVGTTAVITIPKESLN